jgi:GNAT superfamily N-acetyltransferase
MIKLGEDKYYKVSGPLGQVVINNLFAWSVVEKHVIGRIYVDNEDAPRTIHVVHPYNMSFLFGRHDNNEFNSWFRDYALNTNKIRNKFEWMQAFPRSWDIVLERIFKDRLIRYEDNKVNKENGIIELNTRVNFRFNPDKYEDFKKEILNTGFKIVRTDKEIFSEMKGSVVPMYFWNNEDDFYNNGIGFSLFYENNLASTAYSAFIHDRQLELGIETIEAYRSKGFAQYACVALIDYCLENNYEPVWSCRLENTASYKLAQKLGFEPFRQFPYYRLSN